MAAPQLEVVQQGGGGSPPSSKKMFTIGNFKVSKPMFYVVGIIVVLLLVIYVKSKQTAQVYSRPIDYPNGTEMIDNGVDVEAQLQQFGSIMGLHMSSTLKGYDNDLNKMMTEFRNEQNTVLSDLKSENAALQKSLQDLISSQLQTLQKQNESITQTYQPSMGSWYSNGHNFTNGYTYIEVDGNRADLTIDPNNVNWTDEQWANYHKVLNQWNWEHRDPSQIWTSPSFINGQPVDSYDYTKNDSGGNTYHNVYPVKG